jgi:hypothetical protein
MTQLQLELARDLGRSAAEACAEKADCLAPGWIEAAIGALRRFAARQAGAFTVEMARDVIAEEIAEPHDKRAWGVVTRMAVKRAFIARVPGAWAPAASSHASPKPMYRRGSAA